MKQEWKTPLRFGAVLFGLYLAVHYWSRLSALALTALGAGFPLLLGAVMGGALLLDMILGAVAGGSIPLILRALGRDPAQASSIFLTALTDGAGFFIFLSLASLFLLA